MQQRMRTLILQGIDRQNLLELIAICEQLAPTKPAIYVSLICIFRILGSQWDAPDTPDYNEINRRLQKPLVALLDAENQSARVILSRLDDLMAFFWSIL